MRHADMREGREREITLHDVDTEVLSAFLQFLYCCTCDVATEKLVALAALADQYDVGLLQHMCYEAVARHAPNHR